jgi:hypothetical protein
MKSFITTLGICLPLSTGATRKEGDQVVVTATESLAIEVTKPQE